MFSARNIRYGMADRARASVYGGIGAMHLLARRIGLIEALDAHVRLLKVHLPYHESDHILNIAYNILADGQCLQDLEKLRNDETWLDALGASRIPDLRWMQGCSLRTNSGCSGSSGSISR